MSQQYIMARVFAKVREDDYAYVSYMGQPILDLYCTLYTIFTKYIGLRTSVYIAVSRLCITDYCRYMYIQKHNDNNSTEVHVLTIFAELTMTRNSFDLQ